MIIDLKNELRLLMLCDPTNYAGITFLKDQIKILEEEK
jgi:hypothetical protein